MSSPRRSPRAKKEVKMTEPESVSDEEHQEPNKLKRTKTMTETAKEGGEFLKHEPELKHNVVKGRQTRGKKKAGEALDILTDHKKPKHEAEPPSEAQIKKEKEELMMAFRLFDKDHNGKLGKEELANLMRSLGKRPIKHKIDAIFEHADSDKDGFITAAEFVDYTLKKKHEKLAARGEKPTAPTDGSPAAAASPKKAKAKAKAKKAAAKAAAAPAPVARQRSVAEFYNPSAGFHDEIQPVARDVNENPAGREYDLGKEGAFNEFKILIFNGIAAGDSSDQYIGNPLNALRTKGFQVTTTVSEKTVVDTIDNYDQVWIVSGSALKDNSVTTDQFVAAIEKFFNNGKGVAIWADNDPYIVHANLLTEKLASLKLSGNDPGEKILDLAPLGQAPKAGQFGRSLLTSGIVKLFEGETICYPNNTNSVKVLALSSSNQPCIMYRDAENGKGRLVIECGFTKFYDKFWVTAGTERYIRNVAVWLLDLEHRIHKLNEPAPAPQHRALERGESFNVEASSGKIIVGMGWSSPFDLDVSVNVYDSSFNCLETVDFTNLKSKKFPIVHSGDIIVPAKGARGDQEQITVDLKSMPPEAVVMLFVVSMYTPNKHLGSIDNAYVRLIDAQSRAELCRYTIEKGNLKSDEQGHQVPLLDASKSSLVMCKVFFSGGQWRMMTIGESAEGRRAKDMESAGALKKYTFHDYIPEGTKFKDLTK